MNTDRVCCHLANLRLSYSNIIRISKGHRVVTYVALEVRTIKDGLEGLNGYAKLQANLEFKPPYDQCR